MIKQDKIKISLAQISPILGNVEKNIDKHLQYISEARKEKADIFFSLRMESGDPTLCASCK